MSRYADEDTSESLPDSERGLGPTSTENTSPWLPPSPSAVRSPHAELVRRKATSSKDMDEEWGGDDPAHADECAEAEAAINADGWAESPRTLTNARKGKAQCAGGFLRLLRGGGSSAREPGASANAPSARSSADLFRFRRPRGERRSMSWEKAPAEICGGDKSARSAPAERGAAEGTREKAGRGGRTSPEKAAGSGEIRGSRAICVPELPSNAEKGPFSTDEVSAAAGGHVDDDVSKFAGFHLSFEAGIGLGAEASVSTSPKPLPAPNDKPAPASDTASLASAFPLSPATSSAARPHSASTTSSAAFPASSASPHSPAPAGRRMARSASANARSPDMSGVSGHILPPRRSLTVQRTSANGEDISPWSAASPQSGASAATISPRNAAHRAEVQERLKQLQVSFDSSAAGADSDHASPFDEGAYNESAYNEAAESAYTEGADGERGRLNPAGQIEAAAAHAASKGNTPMLSPPPSPQSHSSFSAHAPPHPPASSIPIHARMPSPSASLHAPPAAHQQPSANPVPRPSSPHAPTSSPSSSPSSQHKPIPAIFSRPSPITTPPLHPPAPFALLASSPTHSPTCASPFPSAPSPTCPPVSPSKPPRSPTSSPRLSPSSSRHFHRASSIRLPIPLPPSSFQDPLPSPNLPHSVASCPDCTHCYPSHGLIHISPSSVSYHESPSSISGMGMGTGMGGGTGAGMGMGTGAGSGIEMGMVTGATAITNRRNDPQARGVLHTASPSFSPFHPLIASPEESEAGTGTNQTLRAFTRSQSADCVEGSTALEETGVRVQAGNGRRFMRRNSVDGGSFRGPLGARMGYAAMAAHGRGARSPIKSCLSPANGTGGAKLRKQVSFNKVVQVRRFMSCNSSPEYY
ncbi:unnamed protein product [Closterium sp. NIES-64]|nr:unnamed protein product [Closterium sp. NIES-64]